MLRSHVPVFLSCALFAAAGCSRAIETNTTQTVAKPAVNSSATHSTTHKFTNHLAAEKSPYLLQHAHNPVDWFPWGEAAFAKARNENKPIFLSVGYSTCHWCHVMERESFENEAVGRYLNEHFVSIKVDREERPDVDKIYMTFVQATTGSGGWPMNVFLTADRKPFFGGTYFPPESKYGRPSFMQLLERIAGLWETRRGELETNANQIQGQLSDAMTSTNALGDGTPNPEWLRSAGGTFKEMYDSQNGGFGRAPKFPQPSQPQFLLRYAHRFGDDAAKRMVLHTCERMAAGGIHDHLGGGFARYAVDAEWLVPHFEKMLYDNAQLVQLYLDAHLVGKVESRNRESKNAKRNTQHETDYASVARDILAYVQRDMTHRDGGFYSAEDADSEGHEGKFYCWTRAELSKLLTVEEFNVVVRHFGITEQGNFVDHSHPTPLAGQNVLSIVEPIKGPKSEKAESGKAETKPEHVHAADCDHGSTDAPVLASARAKMIAVRAKRIRPHLDDKILASWNGLMLGAFARAYAVLGDETYRTVAEKNVKFIQDKLWVAPGVKSEIRNQKSEIPTGTLYHRWRDGERDSVQLLDAYAFQLSGVVELYEATLEPKHLDFAIALADSMIEKFYDPKDGGFWQSGADSKDLILRVKDDTDGAEPAGNSVATLALLKLAAITERADYRKAADKTLAAAAGKIEQMPHALPYLLLAFNLSLDDPKRVAITGDPGAADFKALLHAAHSVYEPNKVVLGNRGAVEPFALTLSAKNGAAAYICTGHTCTPPTSDPDALRKLLSH